MWGISALVVVAAFSAAAGSDVIRHNLYGEVGESVEIPVVDFEKDGWWELKKPNADPDWVVSYHGGYAFQFLYESRGQINKSNRTLLLKNLTKSDNWEYEEWANGKLRSKINLQVLDPLYPPLLRIQGPNSRGCLVLLECEGSGGSAETLSLMKDGVKVTGNITVLGNISLLTVSSRDPQSWGQYTCEQRNPLSSKSSNSVMVEHPVSVMETVSFCIVIGGLAFSICVIAFQIFCRTLVPLLNIKTQTRISALINGLSEVELIMRFMSSLGAIVVSALGHYLIDPVRVAIVVISATVFAMRIYLFLVSCRPKRRYKDRLSCLSGIIRRIMFFADYILLPAFFLTETIQFSNNCEYCSWVAVMLFFIGDKGQWFFPHSLLLGKV
ncbi:hypothetical protein XENTR_v10000193 [Xenopus tropicalis]|nr:hypothetical protein XENTR_v10000193 [Xenopus tropicalis]